MKPIKPMLFIALMGLSSLALQGCGGGGSSNNANSGGGDGNNNGDDNTIVTPPVTSNNQLHTLANMEIYHDAQALEDVSQLKNDITALFGNNNDEPVDIADNENLRTVINRLGGQP